MFPYLFLKIMASSSRTFGVECVQLGSNTQGPRLFNFPLLFHPRPQPHPLCPAISPLPQIMASSSRTFSVERVQLSGSAHGPRVFDLTFRPATHAAVDDKAIPVSAPTYINVRSPGCLLPQRLYVVSLEALPESPAAAPAAANVSGPHAYDPATPCTLDLSRGSRGATGSGSGVGSGALTVVPALQLFVGPYGALSAASRIPGLTLRHMLGRGSQGSVYVGDLASTGHGDLHGNGGDAEGVPEVVAVKVITVPHAVGGWSQLLAEVDAGSRISHPNVVGTRAHALVKLGGFCSARVQVVQAEASHGVGRGLSFGSSGGGGLGATRRRSSSGLPGELLSHLSGLVTEAAQGAAGSRGEAGRVEAVGSFSRPEAAPVLLRSMNPADSGEDRWVAGSALPGSWGQGRGSWGQRRLAGGAAEPQLSGLVTEATQGPAGSRGEAGRVEVMGPFSRQEGVPGNCWVSCRGHIVSRLDLSSHLV